MASKKARRLIQLGLHPVLLGSRGDDLKRPCLHGWQTAVYTLVDVSRWSSRHNIGIRCGQQRDGRSLLVFDFDEEAGRIFPAWLSQAARIIAEPPVVVSSGRGYHIYFFTDEPYPSCTLAGKYGQTRSSVYGRMRLIKFIETLGEGRQVVTAGSYHPSGRRYSFYSQATYTNIPHLAEAAYHQLIALARRFDQRPTKALRHGTTPPAHFSGALRGVDNCLAFARRFIGTAEQVENNGDIRFLGHGGLLVTANGRGWYSFSEETGGGLQELIAWYQARKGEGLC